MHRFRKLRDTRRATAHSGLLLALLALGCTTAPVKVEVHSVVDPSTFTTYTQAPPPWQHPVVGERVESEIASLLQSKGYRPAPLGQADLVVVYQATGERTQRRTKVSDPDVFYYKRIDNVIEGMMVIEVFDAGREMLIWQGIGRRDIYNEARTQEAAVKTVRAILGELPSSRGQAPE